VNTLINEGVRKKLEKIENISTVSTAVSSILKSLEDPNISVREAAQLLSQDHAITARVLQIVNSPLYGFPKEIYTIERAFIILGFQAVKNIVISMLTITQISEQRTPRSKANRKAFWVHSLACGVMAKIISKFLGIGNPEELFVCGLVHDIGKVIIEEYFQEDYSEISIRITKDNKTSWEIEKDVIGCEHGEIGGFIAEKWNLPTAICESIAKHHYPEQQTNCSEEVAIIHIADALTYRENLKNPVSKHKGGISKTSFKTLGIPGRNLKGFIECEDFTKQFRKELEKSEIFLSFT